MAIQYDPGSIRIACMMDVMASAAVSPLSSIEYEKINNGVTHFGSYSVGPEEARRRILEDLG